MDIVWNGHACFRLRGRDAIIVTDPYDRTTGFPPLKLTADVVTISHSHPHHASLELVQPAGERRRRDRGDRSQLPAGMSTVRSSTGAFAVVRRCGA